ncbi:MAG: hypothetical protein U0002_11710 [Thermoanaerobaculia bacterium]
MAGVAADAALYLLGATLLGLGFRWLWPELAGRTWAAYVLVVLAFLSPVLLTPAHGVATDIAYSWLPYRGTLEKKLRPQNELLSDPLLQMLPDRALVRERLLALSPPLWSHELATGEPLLGNAQSAPFSPLHLLALPRPPLAAMSLAASWQLLVGLLGMHLLLRRLGGSGAAAALAALSFAFSTFSVVWLYYPMGMAAMWLPAVVLGVLGVASSAAGRALLGLTLPATGMALSGHPETLVYGALVGGLTGLGLLARAGRERFRLLARLAAGAALAFALAAPALLPVLEAIPESQRWSAIEKNPLAVAPPPFEPGLLALLVDPLHLGSPRDGNWNGPSNFNEMASGYAGLLVLALALVGGFSRRGALILLGGLAALAVSLRLPPLFSLVTALPLLGHAPHARLRLLWVLAVAILAGFGLDRLKLGRERAAALAALGLATLALGALPPPEHVSWQQAWWWATLAGLAALFLALALPRLRPWAPRLAVLALAVDLGLLGLRYNPRVAPQYALAPPPALQWLERAAASEPAPLRVVARGFNFLPHLNTLYGLWDPRTGDPMAAAAVDRFEQRLLPPTYFRFGFVARRGAVDRQNEVLPFLRVGYLLTARSDPPGPPWELAFRHSGSWLWRHPAPLPLFFRPREVRLAADSAQALTELTTLEDFGTAALVEPPGARPATAGARAEVLRVEPNGFRLETAGAGLVASSVTASRGWRVVAQGRRLQPLRVDSAFLGFEAPAETGEVRLRYLPSSWLPALALAALALTAVVALALPPPGPRSPAR